MFFWKILFLEKKQWRKPILTQWDFLVLLMILHPWSRGVGVPTLVLLIFRRRCNGSRRYGFWRQLPSACPPASMWVPAGFHLRARRLPSACPPALIYVPASSQLPACTCSRCPQRNKWMQDVGQFSSRIFDVSEVGLLFGKSDRDHKKMALGVLFSRNSHKSFGDSFESRNFAAWNDLRLSSYPSSCFCLLQEWAWINTFAVVSWLLSLSMISPFFSPQAWICPVVSREMAVGNAITSTFTSRFMIRFVRPIPHR